MRSSIKCPGSARNSRAGFGDSPKQALTDDGLLKGKVRDGAVAIASTRDACAPQAITKGAAGEQIDV
jgi:hypothetical protein